MSKRRDDAAQQQLQTRDLCDPAAEGFVERVTPKEPGEDLFLFKCPNDGGVHFRHAGYVEVLAPFIRPGNEKRMAMDGHPVLVCVKCRSSFAFVNEQLYDLTKIIDLGAWEKAEVELQKATGPGGQC